MESYFYKGNKPSAFLSFIKITGFEEVLRSLDPTQDTSQLAKATRWSSAGL